MSFWKDTTYRSEQREIMDDLEMGGPLVIDALDHMSAINKWLGGNRVTINGIEKLLRNHPRNQEVIVIDLGCGNGDMLRQVADFGRKRGYNFKLIGIDANLATIKYARKLSKNYEEITYDQQDIFSEEFQKVKYDVALCTLFLHHFENDFIIKFVKALIGNARKGVVINDLHRHPMAYILFKTISIFIKNHIVKTDGAISILRAFKKPELERFSKMLHLKSTINWCWAFRFQWIIFKNDTLKNTTY